MIHVYFELTKGIPNRGLLNQGHRFWVLREMWLSFITGFNTISHIDVIMILGSWIQIFVEEASLKNIRNIQGIFCCQFCFLSFQSKLPDDKPRFLPGVWSPINILKAVAAGIDVFESVYPLKYRCSCLHCWKLLFEQNYLPVYQCVSELNQYHAVH